MNFFCALAKQAIEVYLKESYILPLPQKIPQEAKKRAGVFVTILKNKQLRGCIGTFTPTQKNIAQEIIHNAVHAATQDPRFSPVQIQELSLLKYEVSILSQPVSIQSIKELDPQKYGILIKSDFGKSALLLPNLENIKTPEEQVAICLKKGSIDPEKEKIQIFKFKTRKYEGSSTI
jgi:AmmeMemoRadiSam system protein A